MNINHVNFAVDLSVIFLSCLIWLGMVMFLRLKKKKSLVCLLFLTIFYVYIISVLYFTEFRFQVLFLLNYVMPGHLMLRAKTVWESMNLIPLITLKLEDVKTSLLNILMLLPFGFGLPFITNFRMKRVIVIGALFGVALELLQLITGLMAKTTFRVVDINDVIFNTVGVAVGYILFVGFMRVYRRIFRNRDMSANPIFRYIALRPQIDERSKVKSEDISITVIVVIIAIAAVFCGHVVYEKAYPKLNAGVGVGGEDNPSGLVGNGQGEIPQSGDLCGGTGGTGEIISQGNKTITIKRQDGVVQTIDFTTQTEIRNSTGPISESDLKIGEHVTLVVDGSKTASIVLVCNITGSETQPGQ